MPFVPGSVNHFERLAKKHKYFAVPKYVVIIDGDEMDPEQFNVLDINIKMSAGVDMSCCDLTLAAGFDQKSGSFKPDVYEEFKPGKPIEVQMGYEYPESLFKGYINALNFEFAASGIHISAQCLDARGALVNSFQWTNHKKDELVSVVIKRVLEERCKKYAKTGEVTFLFDAPVRENMYGNEIDDYRFISGIASESFHSFCVIGNEIKFCDDIMRSAKRTLSLKWGQGLLIDFSTDIDLSRQIGEAKVFGSAQQYKTQIKGNCGSVPDSGESGKDMSEMVESKHRLIYSTLVINDDQAKKLAERCMRASAAELVRCHGTTIGLPEIKCGTIVSISGMGHGINGDYYLTHVSQRINGEGYLTSFDGICSQVAPSGSIGAHRLIP